MRTRAITDADELDVDVDHAVWLCRSAQQGLVQLEPELGVIHRIRGGDGVATRTSSVGSPN